MSLGNYEITAVHGRAGFCKCITSHPEDSVLIVIIFAVISTIRCKPSYKSSGRHSHLTVQLLLLLRADAQLWEVLRQALAY